MAQVSPTGIASTVGFASFGHSQSRESTGSREGQKQHVDSRGIPDTSSSEYMYEGGHQ